MSNQKYIEFYFYSPRYIIYSNQLTSSLDIRVTNFVK